MRRLRRALRLNYCSPGVRRLIVGVIGMTVLLIGIAMVVLPGPAIIVVPLGLMILATEFIWARRCLQKGRQWFRAAKNRVARNKPVTANPPLSARE